MWVWYWEGKRREGRWEVERRVNERTTGRLLPSG